MGSLLAQADGKVTLSTALENSGLIKGIKNISGALGGLGNVVKKLGVGLAAAFATAAVAITKQAVDAYADYEQLTGGIKTLFKDSASKVVAYAENAFYTAGVSANKYMEIVTGFSASLITAMGGDTEKAADVANMALIDMSDNANKMGTALENIQVAYQGFSKQNYTMLDNLKLGYGGTKTEMERLLADANRINAAQGKITNYSIDNLADVYSAIHVIQKEFGIAGATAAEAEGTISGSAAMTAAAWENVLTAISGGGDLDRAINNLVFAISKYFENIVPVVERSLAGIGQLIEKVAPQLVQTVATALIQAIPSLLSAVYQMILGLAKGIYQGIVALFTGGSVGGIKAELNDVAGSAGAAADAQRDLADATEAAGKAAKKSLAGFDELNKLQGDSGGSSSAASVGGFSAGGISVDAEVEDGVSPKIEGIVTKIQELLAPLRDIDFTPAIESFGRLGEAAGGLGKTIGDGLQWAWEHILVPLAEWTIEEAVPAAVDTLAAGFAAWNEVLKVLAPVAEEFWTEVLQPLGEWAGDTLIGALGLIRDLFRKLAKVFEEKGPKIEGIFENIGDAFSEVWRVTEPILSEMTKRYQVDFDAIGGFIEDAVELGIDYLYDLTEFLSDVFAGDWENAWADVKNIFLGTKNALVSIADLLLSDFGVTFGDLEKGLADTWVRIRDAFLETWTDMKTNAKKLVNGLIGLINGMISGVVSGINSVISALNAFSINIPDWDSFGEYAGKKLGFNISHLSTPQIPYLAQGAVLPANKPFLAMVGDQRHGTNVEAPLSTIQEAVALVMEDMAGGMMAGFEATVAVLREILEAIYGIEIGDEVIAKAAQRYQEKMAIVKRGG